jgi:glycosyltransferase involved in cell wall biosynthesis
VVPSLRRAGAETQVIDLVNGLARADGRDHVLCYTPPLDQQNRLNADAVSLTYSPRKGRFDVLSIARRIAAIIDAEAIDIVHCTLQHALMMGFVGRLMARRKPALVAALHTTLNVRAMDDWADRLLYRPMLQRSARVVFVCQAQADYWWARYPELARKSRVIFNGVDTGRFVPAQWREAGEALRESHGIPPKDVLLGCIAGLRPEKGHLLLLRALARVTAAGRGAPTLLLAGRGPMQSAIEAEIERLQLGGRVRLLGEIADVRPVLAACNGTVLPSTAVETFSMAMLESMAMGVPVLASDIGGLGEAIDSGVNGRLLPIGDEAAWAAVLAECQGSPDALQSMGEAARRDVSERFSVARMVSDTGQLLEEVHAEHRPRTNVA